MVAVVTGSSSGIGYETSLTLARNGVTTYATMRNLEKSQQIESAAARERLPIHAMYLDVKDEASVRNGIQEIISQARKNRHSSK